MIASRDPEYYQQLTNITDETVASLFELFGNGTVSFCFLHGEVTWQLRQEV